ncbi:hypothetical protein QBC36DRAFT_78199 [Triangularia setosa]|uniref:Fucose-specific lectin n=1 Tax=Triangularia setosa TaxID=2587417 RepID=A0AAN6VYR4_9PEZI|nr:hypothetical protein QBC36DRAFT_78199 [Podospora setosa]
MAHSTPSMQHSVQPSPHALDDQPGLEVVPYNHLPEVRPEEEPKFYLPQAPSQHPEHKIHLAEDFPQVVNESGKPEVTSPATTEKGTLPVNKSHKRRKCWIIGGTACVVVVIVLCVTLGVVLSLKARNNASNDAVNGTSKPETIRSGSKLSAVGWRNPNGDVERFLYYQDPQGQIRRLRSLAIKGNSTPAWEALPVLDQATNGTSLAVTIALHGTEYNPQTTIYYEVDKKVFGATINEASQPAIQLEDVSGGWNGGLSGDFAMGNGADLAAYWPYIITQPESGHIIEVRDMLQSDLSTSTGRLTVRSLGISAYEGTSLCIVPTSSNFTKIAAPGGYGVVYQKPNQGIAFHVPDNETIVGLYGEQLPETFPEQFVFAPQAPMAAFAVARNSNVDDNLVNIYIVVKSYSSSFGVWFTENLSSWMEESPDALKDVDEDSDIACSTLAPTDLDSEGKEALLEPANGEVRCYFQRGGRLVEVSFGGSMWTELGAVPIL